MKLALIAFALVILPAVLGQTGEVYPCKTDVASVRGVSLSQEPRVNVQCGVANQMSSRIVAGSVVTPNEFPWMAFLRVNFWSGDSAMCGGTVIDGRWILTAAHCTFGAVSITVILGAHDITVNSSDANRQEFTSRKWVVHPSWSYGDVENDIAIVELPVAAVLSEYVRPACLPYADDPNQLGNPVTLLGWGNYSSTPDSGFSTYLRKTLTTVISSAGTTGQCQQQSGVGSFSGDKIICSDGSQGRRFCYGDDGGPMNFYDSYWGTYSVVGIAWIGDKSNDCQNSRLPNIYTRVSYYVNWIYNNTDIVPTPRPVTTTTTTTTTTRPTTTTQTSTTTTTPTPTTTTQTTTTTTTPTPTPTSYPSGFDCKGKPNGVYPNPWNDCSRTFFYCSNEYAYEYVCPDAGTVFNEALCECDYTTNVAGCWDEVKR